VAQTPEEIAAAQAVSDMRQRLAEQALGRQRAQAETAKLLVTFTLAVSATFVATALQVGSPSTLDAWATSAAAVAFLLALLVIILDRLQEPDPAFIDREAQIRGWTDAQKLAAFQAGVAGAQAEGETVVRNVRAVASAQILVSLAAAALAAISLLTP
jgi:hypothetical protein